MFKSEAATETMATTNTFEFVLYALRCGGLCPLTKSSRGHYEFRWTSPGIMWNTLMALGASFIQFIYVTHVLFEQFFIFGPRYVNRINTRPDFLMTMTFRITPAASAIH